jgi:hypothetical protein
VAFGIAFVVIVIAAMALWFSPSASAGPAVWLGLSAARMVLLGAVVVGFALASVVILRSPRLKPTAASRPPSLAQVVAPQAPTVAEEQPGNAERPAVVHHSPVVPRQEAQGRGWLRAADLAARKSQE